MMRATVFATLMLSALAGTVAGAEDVPARVFLQYLNQQAPTILCQENPLAQCMAFEQEQCQTMARTAANECGPRLLERWPETFEENQSNARLYSKQYRQCIYQQWQTLGLVDPIQLNICRNETGQ